MLDYDECSLKNLFGLLGLGGGGSIIVIVSKKEK